MRPGTFPERPLDPRAGVKQGNEQLAAGEIFGKMGVPDTKTPIKVDPRHVSAAHWKNLVQTFDPQTPVRSMGFLG